MARGSFGCSLDNVLTAFTDACFHFSFLFLRLTCSTVQGVLLRQWHSRSNTNHLGSISNGQSCIHLSSFLLCCLIESCDLRFASQALSWRRRRRSQAYWWLAVCLGSHQIMFLQRSGQWTLFFQGFSFNNVLLFVFIRRLCVNLNSARALKRLQITAEASLVLTQTKRSSRSQFGLASLVLTRKRLFENFVLFEFFWVFKK